MPIVYEVNQPAVIDIKKKERRIIPRKLFNPMKHEINVKRKEYLDQTLKAIHD